jgi:autocrine motility factor receptor
VIGEMKMFVGLAKDRLAGLSVTPAVGVSRHVRTLCLLLGIMAADGVSLLLLHSARASLSWAVALLFALDLGIIAVDAAKAALRWGLQQRGGACLCGCARHCSCCVQPPHLTRAPPPPHTRRSSSCVTLLMEEAGAVTAHSFGELDAHTSLLARALALWEGWQGKGREAFLYRAELLADMAVHVLTLLHHVHVWVLHGISFHLLDALLLLDTRAVVVSFVQRVRTHRLHRWGARDGPPRRCGRSGGSSACVLHGRARSSGGRSAVSSVFVRAAGTTSCRVLRRVPPSPHPPTQHCHPGAGRDLP